MRSDSPSVPRTSLAPPPEVSGFGGAAVTAHHLATQTAMELLACGGTAVDAAVGANAVLGVVAPETCGIGGDLFALVLSGDAASPAALNASGRAGGAADAATLRGEGLSSIPWDHPVTATVPGCVDGWMELLGRHGRLPLTEVLGDAIRIAEEGFPVSVELGQSLRSMESRLRGQASAANLYPGDSPARPGSRLRRPDLAATLRAVAAGGREAFYLGAPAAQICAATQHCLTPEDLAENRPDWVEPLSLGVFRQTAWTVPPNSQGYLTLTAAWLLERLAGEFDPVDPAYWHAQIEAYRALAWERDELVTDPGRAPLTASELVDTHRLAMRLAAIDPAAAAIWPAAVAEPGDTTYLCVVDAEGMGVSLIQSNFMGIGSGIGAGDAGFFLHNRGAGFDLRRDHPNELAPGRRPRHTLSPTLWTDDGRLSLLLGTRGGDQQPQLLLQVAAHLRAGLAPAAAQAAPRWLISDLARGEPSRLCVEGRTPPLVIDGLRRRGHDVEVAGDFEPGWGPVSLIAIDRDGLRTAAADRRVATTAAAAR